MGSLARLRAEQQLWSGAGANTLQLAVSASIRLGMFPTVRSWLQRGEGQLATDAPSMATTVAAAAACGAVAGAVIAPLAALKSLLHAGGAHAPPPNTPPLARLRHSASTLLTATKRMTQLEFTTMIWRGALLNSVQITSLAVPTAWALGALRERQGEVKLSTAQQLGAYAFASTISGGMFPSTIRHTLACWCHVTVASYALQ